MQRFALASGMQVALLPRPSRGRAVYASLQLRYGDAASLADRGQVEELALALLERGTQRHSHEQLQDALQAQRSSVQIEHEDPGVASVWLETVREQLPALLELVAEMLREPSFPAAELASARAESQAGLSSERSDPVAHVRRALGRALRPWPPSDPRYRPSFDEESARLRRVTRAQLRALHEQLWGSDAAVLAIVGDFDPQAARAVLEERYAPWRNARAYRRLERRYAPLAAAVQKLDVPGAQTAVVAVAQALQVSERSPDYPALWVARFLLGQGVESRLGRRLRTQEGWAYSVGASLSAGSEDAVGNLLLSAVVRPEVAERAAAAIAQELERLCREGPSPAELQAAQRSLGQELRQELAGHASLAAQLAEGMAQGRTLLWQAQREQQLAALTPEAIAGALQRQIRAAQQLRVIGGPPGQTGAG